jgi:hypothetical protein
MQLDDLVKAANAAEVVIADNLSRTSAAYIALTNAPNAEAGKTALRELQLASRDLAECVRLILTRWDAPPGLLLNVTKRAYQNTALSSNKDPMSGLYLNLAHYFQRMLYSSTQEGKVKELSSFYYIAKELAEIAGDGKSEKYRRSGEIPS